MYTCLWTTNYTLTGCLSGSVLQNAAELHASEHGKRVSDLTTEAIQTKALAAHEHPNPSITSSASDRICTSCTGNFS